MCVEVVAQVIELPESEDGIALVDIDGSVRRVSLVMLRLENIDVSPGDWLLTHTGLAVTVLAPDDARDLIDQRTQMLAALSEGEA
ncbi:MAG: HypC/HybG/HupF family hydrogenase formation chaperone [Candidatus Nanopelagicales bacterium]